MIEYCAHGKSDSTLDSLDPYRRGKGGIAIMWHQQINHSVSVISIDTDRLAGITFELDNKKFVTILAAYLPSTNS
jgi:hypothetical protein